MGKAKFYTDQYLDQMRQLGDPLADKAFISIKQSSGGEVMRDLMARVLRNRDAWPANMPEPMEAYLEQTAVLPHFAHAGKMKRGAEVFSRHADDMLSMLGFASLPYCYAAADGARVLKASPRLIDEPSKRLFETARFVMDVMDPLAFSPQGRAFKSLQKVRLMHAAVRYYIDASGTWDNEAWGVPVNQEDMAGTQLAFWYVPVKSFERIGIRLSKEETDDFRHLWKVIGYLIGVEETLLTDTAHESYLLSKKIAERTIRPSEHGMALTRSLIGHFKDAPIKGPWEKITEPYIRYLLGDQVADAIGIRHEPFADIVLKPILGLKGLQSLISPGNKFYRMRNLLGRELRKELGSEASEKSFSMPGRLGVQPS
jgi:hypothetical protein